MDQLKTLVKRLHEAGISVLGDVVLNHRCAEHQNQNGVWNIFGGRLNWDDRAVVADDPHFQVSCSSTRFPSLNLERKFLMYLNIRTHS